MQLRYDVVGGGSGDFLNEHRGVAGVIATLTSYYRDDSLEDLNSTTALPKIIPLAKICMFTDELVEKVMKC